MSPDTFGLSVLELLPCAVHPRGCYQISEPTPECDECCHVLISLIFQFSDWRDSCCLNHCLESSLGRDCQWLRKWRWSTGCSCSSKDSWKEFSTSSDKSSGIGQRASLTSWEQAKCHRDIHLSWSIDKGNQLGVKELLLAENILLSTAQHITKVLTGTPPQWQPFCPSPSSRLLGRIDPETGPLQGH